MKEMDMSNERAKIYEWFKTFSNSTYSANVVMDITELVNITKKTNTSFFINMLYIVVKGLNSIPEMRMRYVKDKAIIYDTINPAITVMTKANTFENVRFKNIDDYQGFYNEAHKHIESAKNQETLNSDNYNPEDCYDEYYITCLPWITFASVTHPMPDDKQNQSIPRICWGKYYKENERYKINLNITVSHMFVDGYPLSKAFINIQEMLDNANKYLK